MFVSYRGSIMGLLRWQWRPALIFGLVAAAIVVLDRVEHIEVLRVPALPLGIVGGAIGIFVSFRTNSGYDRWWEGRKLWGRLINTSRHFTNQVTTYLADTPELAASRRELVRRHIAYVHVLRCLLRDQDPFADARVLQFLSKAETAELRPETNVTNALLNRQQAQLVELAKREDIDPFRLQSFDESLRALLDIQGGCERIKKTPFPPGYGFLADRLILAFGFLFPLGLVEDLGWLTVPITILVTLGFRLISEVGRVLENPFSLFWPALPLMALSTTIERDLRQRIGDADLPPSPQPDNRGILM